MKLNRISLFLKVQKGERHYEILKSFWALMNRWKEGNLHSKLLFRTTGEEALINGGVIFDRLERVVDFSASSFINRVFV